MGFGVFVTEIEQALLRGEISLAVHSLKSLPTGPREACRSPHFPAAPTRATPSSPAPAAALAELPPAAHVATGSPRRVANLRAHRPNLVFGAVRGNVDMRPSANSTRANSTRSSSPPGPCCDSTSRPASRNAPHLHPPAPGQALALQVRADDTGTASSSARWITRPPRAGHRQRAFLEALGGGYDCP